MVTVKLSDGNGNGDDGGRKKRKVRSNNDVMQLARDWIDSKALDRGLMFVLCTQVTLSNIILDIVL